VRPKPYKAEKKRAAHSAAQASSPDAVKALEQQCRGLWGEMAKMPKRKDLRHAGEARGPRGPVAGAAPSRYSHADQEIA
jgi:hypothetical protein